MVKRGEAQSLSKDVYQRIRNDVFDGTIKPGQRLQPALLGKEHNASTTVVREALAKLAGERVVTSRAGQGYFVPEVQRELLNDLTAVRCHVEGLALEYAMDRGGIDWESRVMAAHHRLARTPRRNADGQRNKEWGEAHHAFHAACYEGSGVPILTELCDQLNAATEVYRAWSSRVIRLEARDVEAEHRQILDAILDGDKKQAVDRLAEHYQATARLIVEQWGEIAASQ